MSQTSIAEKWVDEAAALTRPDRVVWADGSPAEYDRLVSQMLADGTLLPLNGTTHPGCYLHRSHPSDVARTENLTFFCTRARDDAGPTNNWMAPTEAKDKVGPLFRGSMKGRTMWAIPYLMGPAGSTYSRVGIMVTDSPYVVASMHIMTRVGQVALDHMRSPDDFVAGLHSIGGVPVRTTLPRQQGRVLAEEAHELRHGEDHVGGRGVQDDLPSQDGPEAEALGFGNPVAGDEDRPEGAEGVEALSSNPLAAVVLLPAPGRDVVGGGVAQDVLQGSLLGHVARRRPDHHGQLALVVHLGTAGAAGRRIASPGPHTALVGTIAQLSVSLSPAVSSAPSSWTHPTAETWMLIDTWIDRAGRRGSRVGLGDVLIGALASEIGELIWSLDADFERMEVLGLVQRYLP